MHYWVARTVLPTLRFESRMIRLHVLLSHWTIVILEVLIHFKLFSPKSYTQVPWLWAQRDRSDYAIRIWVVIGHHVRGNQWTTPLKRRSIISVRDLYEVSISFKIFLFITCSLRLFLICHFSRAQLLATLGLRGGLLILINKLKLRYNNIILLFRFRVFLFIKLLFSLIVIKRTSIIVICQSWRPHIIFVYNHCRSWRELHFISRIYVI